MSSLREAAQAVLDRWDSPAWEWVKQGPTADLMADLRAALEEYDKDRVKVEEMKANWALQRKLAEETQERDKQQREYEEQRLAALAEPVQEPEPAGWFEGPFGEFRANPLHRIAWPAQTVAWSIPLYLAPPQRKENSDE